MGSPRLSLSALSHFVDLFDKPTQTNGTPNVQILLKAAFQCARGTWQKRSTNGRLLSQGKHNTFKKLKVVKRHVL